MTGGHASRSDTGVCITQSLPGWGLNALRKPLVQTLGGGTVMSRNITKRDKICKNLMTTMRTGIMSTSIITRGTLHYS